MVAVGVICAAPVASMGGWYRAQVVQVYEETDEVDIKFCDYGGYSQLQASSLRQIRLVIIVMIINKGFLQIYQLPQKLVKIFFNFFLGFFIM